MDYDGYQDGLETVSQHLTGIARVILERRPDDAAEKRRAAYRAVTMAVSGMAGGVIWAGCHRRGLDVPDDVAHVAHAPALQNYRKRDDWAKWVERVEAEIVTPSDLPLDTRLDITLRGVSRELGLAALAFAVLGDKEGLALTEAACRRICAAAGTAVADLDARYVDEHLMLGLGGLDALHEALRTLHADFEALLSTLDVDRAS